ncbi:MAG: DUF2934 domain-containing protein [Nitrospirales bacterium]|nr:DUF2934 domain-containing protein [Nitrospirales bacterium]
MIMVVTFQEDFRSHICAFLSEKGYKVCVPPHRQDVIPLMKEKSPVVVVLDMYVAEPNGLEVLRELRAQNYRGKVIALAGISVSSLLSQAYQFGVDQVIGGFQGNGGTLNVDQVELAIRGALHSDIAKRAFELYEARGRKHGKDQEDWLEAEREVFTRNMHLPSSGTISTKIQPGETPKRVTKPKKS